MVSAYSSNILGAGRAEADALMLSSAFIETSDYHALCNTSDFNFVVGRRGTGKTALFLKVSEVFEKSRKGTFLLRCRFLEYETLDLYSFFQKLDIKDYGTVRTICRVMWRLQILFMCLQKLSSFWKLDHFESFARIKEVTDYHNKFFILSSVARCRAFLDAANTTATTPLEIPGNLARLFNIEHLEALVRSSLTETGHSVSVLFDGLDEGWQTNEVSTAILGGLSLAAADFVDHQADIHCILFIRDNIFRSLSHFDPDFSRHIEGSTLRLKWTENSLLHLVANRLRAAMDLQAENDVKIWNRFAQTDLKDRTGFKKCLNMTLYRPRDIIVLLNEAFQLASRENRSQIINSDIEMSAKQISKNRLEDLVKEYDSVFSGLSLLIGSFRGGAARYIVKEAIDRLCLLIDQNDYSQPGSGDLAILGTGKECLFALYSIGFFGLEDQETGSITFCHDGSQYNLQKLIGAEQRICIHPCYWKGLDPMPFGNSHKK